LREERRLVVFENKVLRRIFGPERDEVTMEWRRLHNEELYALYSSPHIRVIKLIRIKWTGRVARRGRGEVHAWFRWGNLRERDHLEDPGLDVRIILKCIFKKPDGGMDWNRPGSG
jgi:hypothetical protein